jgi:hypothetical protein
METRQQHSYRNEQAGRLTRLAFNRIYESRIVAPDPKSCFTKFRQINNLEKYWVWLQDQTPESLRKLEIELAITKTKEVKPTLWKKLVNWIRS